MQLNIHVPKAREHVVRELEAVAHESDHAKSQLVLDAIEQYLRGRRRPKTSRVELPVYPIRVITPLRRADIYDERIERRMQSQ